MLWISIRFEFNKCCTYRNSSYVKMYVLEPNMQENNFSRIFLQFFTDCDDVDTWMLDTLRIVSSEDVGKDEASVQSLLKKHKV